MSFEGEDPLRGVSGWSLPSGEFSHAVDINSELLYRTDRGGIAILSQARQHPASIQRTRRRGLGPRWRRNPRRADAPTAPQIGCGLAVPGPCSVDTASPGLIVKD